MFALFGLGLAELLVTLALILVVVTVLLVFLLRGPPPFR
jgi:hypothetical protein